MADSVDWRAVQAAIWRHHRGYLKPVTHIDLVALDDLLGVARQKQLLLANTEQFLRGEPANNALLWGARGTGKSSLIKAVFNRFRDDGLRLIQVDKAGLTDLPELADTLTERTERFILFCDDLSFDEGEAGLRELKSILEGSIELPPENVRVYATSNRRHLVPETMADNRASKMVEGELHLADAIEEKISLSDRFGLWLSFYSINQEEYLAIVEHLFSGVECDRELLYREAIQFAQMRGVRSGRVARQFFNEAWSRLSRS
ncbi:MAG: ATP-binding protein [Gammaproteobacteria bacterium]|nr:ATP-binding protein [Gammaproteobacteria bacterium]